MTGAQTRMASVAAGLLLIIGAGFVLFSLIIPKAQGIQRLRGERAALSAAVAEEQAMLQAATELLNEYQSIQNLQSNLALALPPEEEMTGIVHQLNGMAKASGVLIESLDLQVLPVRSKSQQAVIEPIGTVQATLVLRGTYESVKAFLDSVETNMRVMDVDSLRVEGGTLGNVLTYNVVIKSYYQL